MWEVRSAELFWENEPRAGEYNLSLAENRHKQALKFWRIWKDLRDGRHPDNWSPKHIEEGKQKALIKLADLCQHELIEAVLENRIGAGLLGYRVRHNGERVTATGDSAVLFSSVRRAAETVTNYHQRPIHTHAKFCMAEILTCAVTNFNEWFYKASAEHLLPLLLHIPRNNTVLLISSLTPEQRSDLIHLLHGQITDDYVIPLDRASEPIDRRAWLFRYIYLNGLARSEIWPEVERFVIATRRGAVRMNRRGEIIMPLGPMFAKVFDRQKREMNKLGMLPKNLGVKKIAEGLKADHGSVTKWLKEDLPLKLESDEKGGVYYTFNLSTIQRCIEITAGKKRGPRPKNK